MKSIRPASFFALIIGVGLGCAGCSNKLLDPTQIGRFRPVPAVNVILDSLGVAEETPVAWGNAAPPEPRDIVAVKNDHALRSGDLVRISIFELFQEGMTMVNDHVVSESGKVSIPEVGVVQAAGLTETQLEEEIRRILSPAILKDPLVTVTLLQSQQRTYSILGNGVPQPGRYPIPRHDFRLTDALATAGGPMQFNVSYVYVSRGRELEAGDVGGESAPGRPSEAGELRLIEPEGPGRTLRPEEPDAADGLNRLSPREIPEPMEPAEPYEREREELETIVPPRKRLPLRERIITGGGASAPEDGGSTVPGGFRILVPEKKPEKKANQEEIVVSPSIMRDAAGEDWEASPSGSGARTEWVFRNNRWVDISVESGAAIDAAAERERAVTAPRGERSADEGLEWISRNGEWIPVGKDGLEDARLPGVTDRGVGTRAASVREVELEWVERNGQWIAVERDRGETEPPVDSERGKRRPSTRKGMLPMEAEWAEAVQTRLMKIPADKLLAGDPRYNVVIKPGDNVYVPVDIIGEFCITGNVNRGGFIGLTGRPMTLKMAIAAAGGLGPLAYPKHCEVIRRIGESREEIVMVDLDKIASGEQPDFFIKPNDLINVGTHPTSRWRAVLRNAFRAAYGFGFVYDRNFAYSDATYGKSFF